jgi:hypothetical protein
MRVIVVTVVEARVIMGNAAHRDSSVLRCVALLEYGMRRRRIIAIKNGPP